MANNNTGNRQIATAFETAKIKNPNHALYRPAPPAAKPAFKPFYKPRTDLPAVNELGNDGVDHINTYYHAETELGIALSVYGDYPFNHPEFGRFRTVHGFICWLSHPNQPDEYRNMTATDAQMLRKVSPSILVPRYRYVLIEATMFKILAHPNLKEMLMGCELPLDHYYRQTTVANKSIRVRPDNAYWMIRGLTELRNSLIENRKPRLDFLLNEADRAVHRKKLSRESETLDPVFVPKQQVVAPVVEEEKTEEKKPGKHRSPSAKRHHKKWKEEKARRRAAQKLGEIVAGVTETVLQQVNGEMIHKEVPVETPTTNTNDSATTESTPDASAVSDD